MNVSTKGACRPDGYYWEYYSGVPSLSHCNLQQKSYQIFTESRLIERAQGEWLKNGCREACLFYEYRHCVRVMETGGYCNSGYPPETHFNPKSRKISTTHDSFLSCSVVKCCTEHDSDTVVLCAKFQNDWAVGINVMDQRNFVRFEFKVCVW